MIFERDSRRGKEEYVEVDETIDQYRYGWDPTSLEGDLRQLATTANVEGYHIWDSNAQLQLGSSASWLAAVSQITGNTLVAHAEASAKKEKVPKVPLDFARTSYAEAQKWLAFRASLADQSPSDLPDHFDAHLVPPAGDVPKELINALKQTAEEILFIQYPIAEAVADGSFRKPIFEQYRHLIAYERDQLQSAITALNHEWDAELDSSSPKGKAQYDAATALYKKAVQLGIETLVPGFRDDRYKLILKHRPKPTGVQRPSSDPHQPFDASRLGDLPRPKKPYEEHPRPFAVPDLSPSSRPIEKPFVPPEMPTAAPEGAPLPPQEKPFDPGNFTPPAAKKPFDASDY